jgi:KaiC/GvpD/RAD55 family RecA-like ATPase
LIKAIESGIPGYDELTTSKLQAGGIAEKFTTLVYGPSKTGKSIFCNQFANHGLSNGEPCLYVTADQGIRQLEKNMMEFEWYIQNYIQNQTIYIIDGISQLSGAKLADTNNIKTTSVGNPGDLMVKVGIGTRFVYRKSSHFRSVLDSVNTMFAFNQKQLVIRVINAYIRRINEAGGSGVMAYTEGVTDEKTEQHLISLFENTIRLDGETIKIKCTMDDGTVNKYESPYQITDKGIVVNI